jgi:hypothetical protein
MVKSAADFAERNTERTLHATNYGLDWMRDVAEQYIHQSKAATRNILALTRETGDALGEQGSAMRERFAAAAEENISNVFECLHKLARVKDPRELVHIQSEFVSRQAQVLGDQTKEFGHTIMKSASEVTKTTLERPEEKVRSRPDAA